MTKAWHKPDNVQTMYILILISYAFLHIIFSCVIDFALLKKYFSNIGID